MNKGDSIPLLELCMVGRAATKKQIILQDKRPGRGQSCEENLSLHQGQQRQEARSDGWPGTLGTLRPWLWDFWSR